MGLYRSILVKTSEPAAGIKKFAMTNLNFCRTAVTKVSKAHVALKRVAITAYLSVVCDPIAQAQTMSAAVTGFQQMIQYGANLTSAIAGLTGIIWGFTALRTMVNASKDGGRGDSKGHSAVWHALGAAGCFTLGGIIFMISNQMFSGAAQSPTLTAPNMTPTQN